MFLKFLLKESIDNSPYPVFIMVEFSVESELLEVIPITSLPIKIQTKQEQENLRFVLIRSKSKEFAGKAITEQVYDLYDLQCSGIRRTGDLFICENSGNMGIAGKVWDSSFVLMEYLTSKAVDLDIRHRHVLELGAGTGIAGLKVALLLKPKSILLTDMTDYVPLLKCNITINNLHHVASADVLEWGKGPNHSLKEEYSLVIASDVVYFPEGYEPLVKTIETLLNRQSQPVEMVYFHNIYIYTTY